MQGFNMGRYYPPDASNPPSFNNSSHPLGKRANKITQGILTVRFELPFAVWCNHCTPPAIIGQGVRFNAEKKKVGNYHTTPIWSFRMKHSACGGWWEIRTDPQNSEYVVVEGARRRDYGTTVKDDTADGDLKFLTEEERQKRREDAFANLEGKMEDKGIEKKNRERVEELYDQAEVWRDPYDVNAKLREVFRGKRKVWRKEDRHKEGMQEKFSLGMDIVDETEADRMRAGLVEFGAKDVGEGGSLEGLAWKPLFGEAEVGDVKDGESARKTKKLKADVAKEKSRLGLQQTLVGNTRAVVDPFLNKEASPTPRVNLGILKRKREAETKDAVAPPSTSRQQEEETVTAVPTKKPALLGALVTTGHSPKGIGDLPPELLLKIADFAAVTDTNSKKILCKLCLVKPLNPTATEALYANIHAGADFNPVLLIRTLLSHPSLAALVRSLKLNAVWNGYRNQKYRIAILNSDDPNTPPVTLEDLQGLTTDPVVKRLLQAPDVHFGAAACALLYLHTPNIHTLKYAVEGHYRKLKLPELSIMVTTRPWEIPFLPSPLLKTPTNYNLLKNVTIRTPHIDIDRIAKLLQLPNLHQLEVWNLRELQSRCNWHWDANLFPDHTSTVRHLTLRGGYLHVDVLSLVSAVDEVR
ncbi:uncharacterized protein J4E87_010623 [Alternaria ethzedia]|uniref:uncharacterized protein n=1 Tax=Alternaria ethzedia TaxID=181014 RepID=UPI0020C54FD8|nr:uncharacterized protein J4E87_010623 [Alternaria ethzedia]KAI4611104.1 hypothetical protein J4E87_010623 [Alternaria ethzedia]